MKITATRRQQDAEMGRFLRAFVGQVRALFKRRAPAHFKRFPNAARPCASCALNPATDTWQSFERTATNLMLAIHQEAAFYCHAPELVDGDYVVREEDGCRKLCAGWGAIVGDPALRDVLIRAATEVLA